MNVELHHPEEIDGHLLGVAEFLAAVQCTLSFSRAVIHAEFDASVIYGVEDGADFVAVVNRFHPDRRVALVVE